MYPHISQAARPVSAPGDAAGLERPQRRQSPWHCFLAVLICLMPVGCKHRGDLADVDDGRFRKGTEFAIQ